MTTLNELKQLIHTTFDIEIDTLQSDTPLAEYGLDSLSMAELLFAVEDHFHVDFPDTPKDVETLVQLANLIDELRLAKAA